MNRLKLEDLLISAKSSIFVVSQGLDTVSHGLGFEEKSKQCIELDNVYNLLEEALKEVQKDLRKELNYKKNKGD